jgi:hypothetical protein
MRHRTLATGIATTPLLGLFPVIGLAGALACNDLEYLMGPGDPVSLTPQALEGRWVRVRVVLSTSSTEPVVSDTAEIPDNGLIYKFTASGGAEESCRCPGLGIAPSALITSYSISGDTLRFHSSDGVLTYLAGTYLAEVTTRRLILRNPGPFPHDLDQDGVPEDVRATFTHQRMRD